MVNFGGFEMPVYYSGIAEEHQAVRNHAGLFDVSHMGQVIIKGKNSQKYLQKMVTSDITSLTPGNAQYTVMCNENGGIIDDLLVYCFPDYYMLVVNAGNLENNIEWLNRNNDVKAHIEDKSKQMSLLAIQGPNSRKIVSDFTQIPLEGLKFYQFIHLNKSLQCTKEAAERLAGESSPKVFISTLALQLATETRRPARSMVRVRSNMAVLARAYQSRQDPAKRTPEARLPTAPDRTGMDRSQEISPGRSMCGTWGPWQRLRRSRCKPTNPSSGAPLMGAPL